MIQSTQDLFLFVDDPYLLRDMSDCTLKITIKTNMYSQITLHNPPFHI